MVSYNALYASLHFSLAGLILIKVLALCTYFLLMHLTVHNKGLDQAIKESRA